MIQAGLSVRGRGTWPTCMTMWVERPGMILRTWMAAHMQVDTAGSGRETQLLASADHETWAEVKTKLTPKDLHLGGLNTQIFSAKVQDVAPGLEETS